MTHFLICDTDTEFLSRLAAVLHRLFDPCKVEYMYGPSALEVSLQSPSGGGDILITEIELRGKSAIEIIAQNLRDSSPLQVIYMTPKMEYCTEVYETRHCGLLLKPVEIACLEKNVNRALRLLEQNRRSGIVVYKQGCLHVVRAASIICVESSGRVIRVITETESLESYEKLSNFAYQLDKRFLQCHKSYLINMERVRKYQGNCFLMENGMVVPVSQSRRKEVRDRFLEYAGIAGAASRLGL